MSEQTTTDRIGDATRRIESMLCDAIEDLVSELDDAMTYDPVSKIGIVVNRAKSVVAIVREAHARKAGGA